MGFNCGVVPILRPSNVVKTLLSVLLYGRHDFIHRDMIITSIQDEFTKIVRKHEMKLDQYTNPAAIQLLDNSQDYRRLKRHIPNDLV